MPPSPPPPLQRGGARTRAERRTNIQKANPLGVNNSYMLFGTIFTFNT